MGIAVVALALLVYANTLANGFAYDDISIVQTNPYITDWRQIPWLFTKGYWSHKSGGVGNYRPLTIVTFTVEYALWGLAPLGYHLTNVLLMQPMLHCCLACSAVTASHRALPAWRRWCLPYTRFTPRPWPMSSGAANC
jgi:hypothetical protein